MAIGKIVFVGAGAIGGSVAVWLAEGREAVFCHDRPEVMDAIDARGISHYDGALGKERATKVAVKTLRSLEGLGEDDVLVFGVKNFILDEVAREASRATGGRPLALSMANGLDNQEIMPRHFKRVVYAVVGYNAWLDGPGLIGWQNRGPLVLGTPDNSLQPELAELGAVFSRGLETVVTDRIVDAAHSKLVVNLINTITTLVGQGYRPITDIASMQRLVSQTLYEGVRAVLAAGHREYHVGNMPGFSKIRASATLPAFVTRGMFKKSLAKMVRSSMSQDVLLRGGTATELESLTGYIVKLAEKNRMAAPWNAGLYRIAKEAFAKPGFTPFEPAALVKAIESGGMPAKG
jgi:2-dehydropantoate 2-reductase